MDLRVEYEKRKQRVAEQLKSASGSVALEKAKNTSNLFRQVKVSTQKLDVRDFNHVIEVNEQEGWVEVEGMTTFADLVDALLPQGVMPTVVPQLKSITIGGAVSGGGIEASSFKFGFVHETVMEMEVLLPDGRIVVCTPNNEHRDLFFGLPVSYGTLGYILKLKVQTNPVKPYVRLRHIKYRDPVEYFAAIQHWCRQPVNFVDGVIFEPDEMYITVGEFVNSAPYTSDYTFQHIYYRSLRQRTKDFLTTHNYIWRWDTDWFWCSKNLYAQNPIVRRLLGKKRLNSITYTKIMRWSSRWKVGHALHRLQGLHAESVIQDVEIPVENAPAFLEFFHREIGIKPIWVCPARAYRSNVEFPLYRTRSDTLYINFGFWDVVRGRQKLPEGYYNKKVERKVQELGGMKSLYSDVYYEPAEFWRIYNKSAYDQLKATYDPQGKFPDLYQRCVGAA